MSKKVIELAVLIVLGAPSLFSQSMDALWGEGVVKLRAEDAARGQLFEDGNYAMFIHWGLYSQLANKVDGKTYYGIGEWIMKRAEIPVAEYEKLAEELGAQAVRLNGPHYWMMDSQEIRLKADFN